MTWTGACGACTKNSDAGCANVKFCNSGGLAEVAYYTFDAVLRYQHSQLHRGRGWFAVTLVCLECNWMCFVVLLLSRCVQQQ